MMYTLNAIRKKEAKIFYSGAAIILQWIRGRPCMCIPDLILEVLSIARYSPQTQATTKIIISYMNVSNLCKGWSDSKRYINIP